MFSEGDLVEIPLPDGQIAVGRIIHFSQCIPDSVGFVVFGIKDQIRIEDMDVQGQPGVAGVMYTGLDAAVDYEWKVVAHVPISEQDRLMTRREFAGGVYVCDECIGSVQELGEYGLKTAFSGGMRAIFIKLEKLLPHPAELLQSGESNGRKSVAQANNDSDVPNELSAGNPTILWIEIPSVAHWPTPDETEIRDAIERDISRLGIGVCSGVGAGQGKLDISFHVKDKEHAKKIVSARLKDLYPDLEWTVR